MAHRGPEHLHRTTQRHCRVRESAGLKLRLIRTTGPRTSIPDDEVVAGTIEVDPTTVNGFTEDDNPTPKNNIVAPDGFLLPVSLFLETCRLVG